MKRYLLFIFDVGYDSYSGSKGWDAFEGDFNSIDDARRCALDDEILPLNLDRVSWNYHIVDIQTKAVVESLDIATANGTIPVCGRTITASVPTGGERRPLHVRLGPA